MKRLEAVNDFVVKFANVNGSGSASANELFAKAILRMGVPVSPRNIFPSNIQGLPTWYEVRVSEKGYLGRRGGIDMMVAMNPQTWEQDLAEIEPGGYLFYDSTKPLPKSAFRDDLHVIGMPITAICNATYEDARQRQLFKNILYIGALSVLLDIDAKEIEELFSEQYRGKERLLESNVRALHAGREFARDHLDPIGLRVRYSKAVGDRIFIDGNSAAALGCVYGGATVCAWYPITPSSSCAEAFQKYCSKYRVDKATGANNYAIVQAEDEIASIGIVIGAGWNGARAFTATSGPGVSLMTEFIGLAYFAEIPMTIINVQRGGPSTGMPTRTQQADLIACAYASHGDTKHVLLFPEGPNECFEQAVASLDLADRLQTPVFLMTDLDIGMNQRLTAPFQWDDARRFDRGKVMSAEELEAGREFGRYKDVDGDGIPWRTLPGTHPSKGAYFTRGTTRDEYARYSESGPHYNYNVQRLLRKFATAATMVPQPVVRAAAQPTRLGVLYYGSTSPAMSEALDALSDAGIHVDAMRLRAFPFAASVRQFVSDHDTVFVVEQNRDAQMRSLLINELEIDPALLTPVLHYDGTPITARFIIQSITKQVLAIAVKPLAKPKARSREPAA
jgi:2-oxoglutarate/2-oxoacid ferredoxin oxidoreductase subunit alpha